MRHVGSFLTDLYLTETFTIYFFLLQHTFSSLNEGAVLNCTLRLISKANSASWWSTASSICCMTSVQRVKTVYKHKMLLWNGMVPNATLLCWDIYCTLHNQLLERFKLWRWLMCNHTGARIQTMTDLLFHTSLFSTINFITIGTNSIGNLQFGITHLLNKMWQTHAD